ncbi:MAG TPA: hypothetical protein PK156_39910 [Polyangium sp.]|nr:hypothetical protein [Polyangium sp.]
MLPNLSTSLRPPSPISAFLMLGALASDAHAEPPKSGWSYVAMAGLSNDNLLAPSLFAPTDRLDPSSSSYADDDGRTFGIVFEQALTNERRGLQFITSSWYEMLTQDGSQEDPSRDLRADMLNNIFQVNQRFDLDLGLSLFVGMGLGVQTVGDLDGIRLQSWWHREGGFGGRWLGYGLQDDYGQMQGSVSAPAASQGVRLGKQFGEDAGWHERVSLGYSALVALGGSGMSFGQVDVMGRVGHPKWVDVWAGVLISGGRANDGYLSFAPITHGALGYELGISLNFLHNLHIPVSPCVMIQSNGSGLADTTFTSAFVFGRGSWPWLRPPR